MVGLDGDAVKIWAQGAVVAMLIFTLAYGIIRTIDDVACAMGWLK